MMFFFFKPKTAYEMRISDWSSDVCSSDLRAVTAEEYWPDMEGLEYRDTVTDFGLPQGTFFDAAFVHVLTTATLDRLRALYPQGRFEVRRFRPKIGRASCRESVCQYV